MADREASADAFSAFLTRTAPPDQSQLRAAVTAEVLPRVSEVLDTLSDGRAHTVDELRSKVSFGVLELADTIKLLQANRLVTVRAEQVSAGVEEVVELSDEARRNRR